MIYIMTALKSEAQAFVERFRLQKERCEGHTIYKGKDMVVIVSGVGVQNAKRATQAICRSFDTDADDIFLNVGICAAQKDIKISQLIEVGSIKYNGFVYTFNDTAKEITCLDHEAEDDIYEIADMESFGFYSALEDRDIYIFKVVSDHFEPHKVTKDGTKSLISGAIDDIFKKVGI